jgi:3-dehydroquinate synthase class II
MANPNIVNVTSIYGKTVTAALTTTSTAIVTNASESGKVLKINTVIVTNVDGASAADVTVAYGDATGTSPVASTISVPADSALTVLDKSTSVYVEENKSIYASASAAGDLVILISYEEIS